MKIMSYGEFEKRCLDNIKEGDDIPTSSQIFTIWLMYSTVAKVNLDKILREMRQSWE